MEFAIVYLRDGFMFHWTCGYRVYACRLSTLLHYRRRKGIKSRGLHIPPHLSRFALLASSTLHRSTKRTNLRDAVIIIPSSLYVHHGHHVPED